MLQRRGTFLLKDDLDANELARINQMPTELLEEFAEFASGGEFAFAWDD